MTMDSSGILINWNMGGLEDYAEAKQEKVKVGNQEGYLCIRCGEFSPYAEINQANNTFKCWSCRNGLGKNV